MPRVEPWPRNQRALTLDPAFPNSLQLSGQGQVTSVALFPPPRAQGAGTAAGMGRGWGVGGGREDAAECFSSIPLSPWSDDGPSSWSAARGSGRGGGGRLREAERGKWPGSCVFFLYCTSIYWASIMRQASTVLPGGGHGVQLGLIGRGNRNTSHTG